MNISLSIVTHTLSHKVKTPIKQFVCIPIIFLYTTESNILENFSIKSGGRGNDLVASIS